MALPSNPRDLERAKFREVPTDTGKVALAVTNPDGTPISTIAADGSTIIGGSATGFRSEFVNGINATVWDSSIDANDIAVQGGNAFGASYLRISKSPLVANTETSITSKQTFTFPFKFGAGLSLSQRIVGQEFSFELVGVDSADAVTNSAPVANIAISGNITVTTNVWTINTTAAHGLHGNDRIVLTGCLDSRLNVGPVNVTSVLSATQFTITSTLANATYTATGGQVVWADAFAYAYNAAGILYEIATVTNATFATRRNGSSYRNLNNTVATTTAVQSTTTNFSDAFNSANNNELYASVDEVSYRSITPDGVAVPSGLNKYSQSLPDNSYNYKIRLRAKNLPNFSPTVARITGIAKTGTTTATVTTDVPHGLSTSDWVQIYGVRDITNFPNLTAQTAVASVPTSTTFTIIIGSASTTSSSGGAVIRNQGSILSPAANFTIQSIARASNILTVTLNTTATLALPGEYYHIYGLEGSAQQYEGGYKVLQITGSTVLLESVGSDFGSINTGGMLIKRTDYRIHYVKAVDYTRLVAEIVGGRGNATDINNSVPVSVTNAVPSVTTVSTVSTVTNGNLGLPSTIADVASAALISTTTTATLVPTFGTAYQVNIPVTAVSGSSPTLDFQIQESRDTGTNWVAVYDFPRITATGSYNSPVLTMTGNRLRYVQTVAGSTPSFTRAVNRLQQSNPGKIIRQIVDRTINVNSLNSVTPSLASEQSTTGVTLTVNTGAITTTAPQFQIEASDDFGTTWYAIGAPLVAVASSTVSLTVNNIAPQVFRARVSTAGSGATAGYVLLRAF